MHNSALPNLPGEPVFESGKDLTFIAGTFSEDVLFYSYVSFLQLTFY